MTDDAGDSTCIDPTPLVDTPLKQAIRRAFDHPTVANIEAVADVSVAELTATVETLRNALSYDAEDALQWRCEYEKAEQARDRLLAAVQTLTTERDVMRDALNEKLSDFANHGDTLTLTVDAETYTRWSRMIGNWQEVHGEIDKLERERDRFLAAVGQLQQRLRDAATAVMQDGGWNGNPWDSRGARKDFAEWLTDILLELEKGSTAFIEGR